MTPLTHEESAAIRAIDADALRTYMVDTDAVPTHTVRAACSIDAIVQTLERFPQARRISAKVIV